MKATKELINVYFRENSFMIEIADDNEELSHWKNQFQKNKLKALFHLGFIIKKDWFTPQLTYLYHIAEKLIQKLSNQSDIELTRENVMVELTFEEILELKENVPYAIGMEYVTDEWLMQLWESLLAIFQEEIEQYDGMVATYFTEHNANINVAGRVFFHMVENSDEKFPFAFLATYSTKPAKSKKTIHTPLKNALEEFKGQDQKLLSLLTTVTKVSEDSPFISALMESGELFQPLKLTVGEAYTFLGEIPLYEDYGIMCRVPDWWRKKSNRLNVSVSVGSKEPSKVGLDAIMDFSAELYLGEEKLTEKELREFLQMAEGLTLYNGKWIEINKQKLESALEAFEKVKELTESGEFSLNEALRLELGNQSLVEVDSDDIDVSISNGDWLKQVRERLVNPKSMQHVETVPTFNATLREYQKDGYQWLNAISSYGFGACLADDMGLGKTIQMIAFLEYYRTTKSGHALLVLPASLIGNWQKEIEKFAPEMTVKILHSSAGTITEDLIDEACFLHITTYGMAMRLEELKNKNWDILILDEAQAIKNPGTKQTKEIKKIPSKLRIAMTGTPIENRLSDLWSLFDFLNQGLLGTAKEFKELEKELKNETTGYAKIKKTIQPFILRRLKTDKSIISDLPDKIEIDEYATLSKKQVALYQKLVKSIETKLQDAEGIERKGLVLSSIMKFKQICNHPDQYLSREDYKSDHSGKFEQLKNICETIYEKRERVLIFTQFKELTEPLSEFLAQIFGKEGLVLHGGTSVKKRNEMVEKFNGEEYVPYMVLSLKAGGVGLNLTAANHVIHFDRWWNPAIENQATDRAFRIGQKKNVIVHKFVTKGTIEEKIDDMLREKRKLAGEILGSQGEQWITELSNEELLDLFTLGGDK